MSMSIISKNTLDTSKSLDDRYLCIKCQEIPNYFRISNSSINENDDTYYEFAKLTCEYCTIKYCYILCAFCNKKIYMKINPNYSKYNGINGFNVKCPYESCKNYFYFTECIKCKRSQKQKKFIKEGSVIKCLYKDCKYKYIQVSCPVKNCPDLMYLEKLKDSKNYPNGIMYLHKNEVLYQKINCSFCSQPIVFLSKKNKKNRYFECQQVVCPYKNCGKSFNRIICPNCYDEIYVSDGWYKMGSNIKCKKCNNRFGKILCVSCNQNNICYNNNFFEFGKMKCGFEKCGNENYMINCIYCRKLNIFNKKIPMVGQVIKCGYCQKIFNEIFCPFCKLENPFPLADFSYGKIYKCKYLTCSKSFQFLICPNCFQISFIKETKEGNKFKCDQCNLYFMNWGCPFCKSTIMCKNDTLKLGKMIKCPSKQCGKIYSFIRCCKCDRLIFSKENQNIIGMSVQCPYPECKSYTLFSECTICNTKIIYSGKIKNYEENEKVECNSCKEHYRFRRDKKIHEDDLFTLDIVEGNTFDFGVGEIDENYLAKKDLFFDKSYYSSSLNNFVIDKDSNNAPIQNKVFDECIVCNNNLKESIFYPCGHRCVCYHCAVFIFTVYKKCPKCNQKAVCIIRKIFQ